MVEVENTTTRKLILLLGGSSFMGLTLLKQLAKMTDKYHICVVNRGKSYWDGESTKIMA